MIQVDPNQLWSDFLDAWPPERVRQMQLDEYTNLDKDDAFIYWLESRLTTMGSIWGGSAFKFGIFSQATPKTKPPTEGRCWGEKYAWLTKFGATESKAFTTIRGRLVEVIEAVQAKNLARIDEIDLPPMLKWKVAFLYQDRNSPILFPVYAKAALFHHYRLIDPGAKLASTSYHVMYETLLERHRDVGDVFAISEALWSQFEASRAAGPVAWAVPLAWVLDATTVDALCLKKHVDAEDVDAFLDKLLSTAELGEGDLLALLIEGDVRALGKVTCAEPGQYAWDQEPVNFPSNLLVNPTSELRKLDASEQQEIWSHLPAPVVNDVSGSAPRYWKIAPGPNAVAWPEWRDRGLVAIGWGGLGDLGTLTRSEFDKRAKKNGYSPGVSQAWLFRQIKVGDRVVANQGTHSVLGIGTVVRGYAFRPGKHTVEGEDFPHQVDVRWDDTTKRSINKGGWRQTLLEIKSKEEFEALIGAGPISIAPPPPDAPPEPVPPPCIARNVILYGPPGTGKTYSTVRRALELILGPDKLQGLSEKGLTALFREHKARGQIEFVTFHQAYGYEEFIEGIRPVLDQGADAEVRYELHDGVFKRIALRAAAEGLRPETAEPGKTEAMAPRARVLHAINNKRGGTTSFAFSTKTPQYVLIIDEINRGNMSKILGELMTLLEKDKRLTGTSELTLPLSYSPGQHFGVPPNLHILGTMNTADRSIALMDVALRRRFTFEELMPDPGILREELRARVPSKPFIDLVVEVFESLNDRIRFLYDRDHQLGHSYFLEAENAEALRLVFVDRVIPMLQEYFYGAWDKICTVLGCPYSAEGEPRRGGAHLVDKAGTKTYLWPLVSARTFLEKETLGFDHEDYEDRVDHFVSPKFQRGGLSEEELYRTFLSILVLDAATFQTRLDALLQASSPSTESP